MLSFSSFGWMGQHPPGLTVGRPLRDTWAALARNQNASDFARATVNGRLPSRARIGAWGAALLAAGSLCTAQAQMPGEWRYVIATDLKDIPADMRVNFPTINFSACRSAEDFSSGRAFALQTLASSAERCPSTTFERAPLLRAAPGAAPAGAAEDISFRYACDGGKTLDGSARGRVTAKRFEIALESRYIPASQGVERVRQRMTGTWLGPCKVKPDADDLSIKSK